jgi:hypothetical protein
MFILLINGLPGRLLILFQGTPKQLETVACFLSPVLIRLRATTINNMI